MKKYIFLLIAVAISMPLASCDWDPTGHAHGHGNGHGNGNGHDNDSTHVERETQNFHLLVGESYKTKTKTIQLLNASIDENGIESAEVLITSIDGTTIEVTLTSDSPTYTTEDLFKITLSFLYSAGGESYFAEFLISY